MKQARCPHCRYPARAGHVVNKVGRTHEPKAGDIAVCVRCAGLAVFTRGMRLRTMMAGELARRLEDAEFAAALDRYQAAVRLAIYQRGNGPVRTPAGIIVVDP